MKKEPLSTMEFVESLLVETPDIMLMTATATQLVVYEQQLGELGLGFGYSANVDYYELGNIAFKISTETLPVFRYLSTFSSEIWFSLIISTLVSTIFSCLINKNFSQFFDYFWSFSTLIVTKEVPKLFSTDKWSLKILLTSHFMSILTLSIYFCAHLLDSMVRATPIVIIDSWDDLYHRPNVKIFAAKDCPLYQFAQSESNKSEMARSFKDRIDYFEWETMYTSNKSQLFYEKIKSGEFAFIRKKVALNYELKRYANKYNDSNFLNEIHVSEDGGGFIPFFIPVNKDIDEDLLKRINKM